MEVSTANGDVEITHKCRVYVFEWQIWVWAHILEETVAVLSLGALCDDEGFTYMWNTGEVPTLRKGEIVVECHPRNNVPLIYTSEGNLATVTDKEVQDILDDLDPPPTPDPEWETIRRPRKGKSRG